MAAFCYSKFSDLWRKGCTILLALSFLSGLLLGVFTYLTAEDSLFLLMRSTFHDSVSIVTLLSVACLPFFFSAFAVYISRPGFIVAVSFGKAFLFAFASLAIYGCIYGFERVLFRLIIFTDFLSMTVMYFFWLRHLSGERVVSFPVLGMYLSLIILIESLYFRYFSPLWAYMNF